MNTVIAKSLLRTVALACIAGAAGCNGTLHTRWVQDADTHSLWSSRMAELPIRLHQPGKDAIVQTRDGHPRTTQGVMAMPRVELYVGGTQAPTYESACTATTTLRADTITKPGTLVFAALCDGPRLVDVAEDHLKPAQATPAFPLFRKIEDRLLRAIRISTAQTYIPQYG